MNATTGLQQGVGPSSPVPKQELIKNERVRLWATALNDGAVAAVVAAVVRPAAAELYGITTPTTPSLWVFGAGWIILAAAVHLAARRLPGDLEA